VWIRGTPDLWFDGFDELGCEFEKEREWGNSQEYISDRGKGDPGGTGKEVREAGGERKGERDYSSVG
jgi:hypothetical protein